MSEMTQRAIGVSDAAVARVLARAAELDAAPDTLSLDELRRVALDAGLAPDAVERALREYRAGLLAGPTPSRPRRRAGGILSYWTSLLIPAAAVNGFFSGAIEDLAFVTVPGLAAAVIGAALEHREGGSTGTYLVIASLTWLAFGIGVVLGLGQIHGDVVLVVGAAGAISAFAGAVVTKARSWRSARASME